MSGPMEEQLTNPYTNFWSLIHEQDKCSELGHLFIMDKWWLFGEVDYHLFESEDLISIFPVVVDLARPDDMIRFCFTVDLTERVYRAIFVELGSPYVIKSIEPDEDDENLQFTAMVKDYLMETFSDFDKTVEVMATTTARKEQILSGGSVTDLPTIGTPQEDCNK